MQRYNIFFPIHKGLRAMLYETALRLQQTNYTDVDESDEMINDLKSVINFFDHHAHIEDNFILPAISSYEPSVVDAFEQEHHEDHALGERLQALLTAFETAATTAVRRRTGNDLTIAFTHFVTFNLAHMAKEEVVINNLLWRYYSDAELQAISQNIISTMPPQQMMTGSKWMLRGMSNNEITDWLKQVKNTAPAPVCRQLLLLAESELPAYRWNTILESVTEGAMVA